MMKPHKYKHKVKKLKTAIGIYRTSLKTKGHVPPGDAEGTIWTMANDLSSQRP